MPYNIPAPRKKDAENCSVTKAIEEIQILRVRVEALELLHKLDKKDDRGVK